MLGKRWQETASERNKEKVRKPHKFPYCYEQIEAWTQSALTLHS